jgi:hypothetical protein
MDRSDQRADQRLVSELYRPSSYRQSAVCLPLCWVPAPTGSRRMLPQLMLRGRERVHSLDYIVMNLDESLMYSAM